MLLTAPVAAHIIARAAYKQGVPFWGQNLVDELDEVVKKRDGLEEKLSKDNNNIEARLQLIDCYLALPPIQGGSFKKAVLIASELKDIDTAEGHRALGMIYTLDEEYNLAEDEYKSAVEVSGNQLNYKYDLGRFYFKAKWYKQSLAVFENIWQENNTEVNALFELGKTAAISGLMLKRGGEALSDYLKIESSPESHNQVDAYYFMGVILFKLKLALKAKEYFEKVVNVDPNHINANYYLKRIK
jgi:tetratricopeptide (TPR) repeat protein